MILIQMNDLRFIGKVTILSGCFKCGEEVVYLMILIQMNDLRFIGKVTILSGCFKCGEERFFCLFLDSYVRLGNSSLVLPVSLLPVLP